MVCLARQSARPFVVALSNARPVLAACIGLQNFRIRACNWDGHDDVYCLTESYQGPRLQDDVLSSH